MKLLFRKHSFPLLSFIFCHSCLCLRFRYFLSVIFISVWYSFHIFLFLFYICFFPFVLFRCFLALLLFHFFYFFSFLFLCAISPRIPVVLPFSPVFFTAASLFYIMLFCIMLYYIIILCISLPCFFLSLLCLCVFHSSTLIPYPVFNPSVFFTSVSSVFFSGVQLPCPSV